MLTNDDIDQFAIAFGLTMGNEGLGLLSHDKYDRGGQTYSGISRVHWPEWPGWKLVDEWVDNGLSQSFAKPEGLAEMVKDFYRVNFWNRIQGDQLARLYPEVAYEVFDSAVNMGVTQAIRFLQEGHNVGSGKSQELVVDGKLGPVTMAAIGKFLGSWAVNAQILINCLNGEQYIFYKNNPQHKRYRGWFNRL